MQADNKYNEFFNTWKLYDQVLDHNYMFHEELYRDVHTFISQRYGDHPFTLLDLGCGSARHMAVALRESKINRYTGYDLSPMALAHAKSNLDVFDCRVELHQQDLLDGINKTQDKFDVIFCSFALHHLSSAAKQDFFQTAYQKLKVQGIFLLIDVVRNENEDRVLYLQHYCDWLRREWHVIPTEGLDMICEHIRGNDFPETITDLYAMAKQAGFQTNAEIASYRWHHLMCFEKNET